MKTKHLNVEQVLQEFKEMEQKKTKQRGTFKIDKTFDEALHIIMKAKPDQKSRKENNHARRTGSANRHGP